MEIGSIKAAKYGAEFPVPMRKVSITGAFLCMAESGLELFSELVRDAAVLVLVFVPIDWWKDKASWKPDSVVILVVGSLLVFGIGLALHWTSQLVKWARGIYEEEDMP